jgi:hypothetical protein
MRSTSTATIAHRREVVLTKGAGGVSAAHRLGHFLRTNFEASGLQMRRRVPFGAAAWPLAARAQQPGIPVIGFLDTSSLEATKEIVANFRRGLRDAGYVEGKNVAIEFRWSNDQRILAEMAADLFRRNLDVIFASGASGLNTCCHCL